MKEDEILAKKSKRVKFLLIVLTGTLLTLPAIFETTAVSMDEGYLA